MKNLKTLLILIFLLLLSSCSRPPAETPETAEAPTQELPAPSSPEASEALSPELPAEEIPETIEASDQEIPSEETPAAEAPALDPEEEALLWRERLQEEYISQEIVPLEYPTYRFANPDQRRPETVRPEILRRNDGGETEEFSLDLSLMSEEEKISFLIDQWNPRRREGENFDLRYAYLYADHISFTDDYRYQNEPYYMYSVGMWRINGGDIEIMVTAIWVSVGAKELQGVRYVPNSYTLWQVRRAQVPEGPGEWMTIGSLESVRIFGLPGEGQDYEVRITLRLPENGLPGEERYYRAAKSKSARAHIRGEGEEEIPEAPRGWARVPTEGSPLDLRGMTRRNKENFIAKAWAVNFPVPDQIDMRFGLDHSYWGFDEELERRNPYYTSSYGVWRLNGNNIEVKITHYEVGEPGRVIYAGQMLDFIPFVTRYRKIEVEGTDYQVIGSLESARVGIVEVEEGNLWNTTTYFRLSLRKFYNRGLSDEEEYFWGFDNTEFWDEE